MNDCFARKAPLPQVVTKAAFLLVLTASATANAHPGHSVEETVQTRPDFMHFVEHVVLNPVLFMAVCAVVFGYRLVRRFIKAGRP